MHACRNPCKMHICKSMVKRRKIKVIVSELTFFLLNVSFILKDIFYKLNDWNPPIVSKNDIYPTPLKLRISTLITTNELSVVYRGVGSNWNGNDAYIYIYKKKSPKQRIFGRNLSIFRKKNCWLLKKVASGFPSISVRAKNHLKG